MCIDNGWLDKDLFIKYKPKVKIVARDYLTKEELETMAVKTYSSLRIEQVKDIFIFCCYTGLAYVDVLNLQTGNIVIGIDGENWIKTSRCMLWRC